MNIQPPASFGVFTLGGFVKAMAFIFVSFVLGMAVLLWHGGVLS